MRARSVPIPGSEGGFRTTILASYRLWLPSGGTWQVESALTATGVRKASAPGSAYGRVSFGHAVECGPDARDRTGAASLAGDVRILRNESALRPANHHHGARSLDRDQGVQPLPGPDLRRAGRPGRRRQELRAERRLRASRRQGAERWADDVRAAEPGAIAQPKHTLPDGAELPDVLHGARPVGRRRKRRAAATRSLPRRRSRRLRDDLLQRRRHSARRRDGRSGAFGRRRVVLPPGGWGAHRRPLPVDGRGAAVQRRRDGLPADGVASAQLSHDGNRPPPGGAEPTRRPRESGLRQPALPGEALPAWTGGNPFRVRAPTSRGSTVRPMAA